MYKLVMALLLIPTIVSAQTVINGWKLIGTYSAPRADRPGSFLLVETEHVESGKRRLLIHDGTRFTVSIFLSEPFVTTDPNSILQHAVNSGLLITPDGFGPPDPPPTPEPTPGPTPTVPPTPSLGAVGSWNLDEAAGFFALDSSGNHNNGALKGNPVWTDGKKNGAIHLNGTQDIIVPNSPSLSISGTGLTLAGWIYPTSGEGVIIHKDTHYSMYRKIDGSIAYADSKTWSYATLGSYGTAPVNVWTHVAVSFNGNEIKYYINGTLTHTQVRPGSITSNNNPVYLGSYSGTTGKFIGKLDELRIFNRALTDQEVSVLAGN